jgi:opacity protein-like surface antigen
MRRSPVTAFFASILTCALPAAAGAQGAVVHASAAAAVSDGQTSPAFGGGVTYLFNRVLGLGIELTEVRGLPADFARIYCCREDGAVARATVFTTNVRLEIPTTSRRVIPFVVAGGGVAGVTQSYRVFYAQLAQGVDLAALGLSILPGPSEVENTSTNMALTLGGGASVLVTGRFAVDADLRVLHVTGNDGRNIGRFGAGVSYRF